MKKLKCWVCGSQEEGDTVYKKYYRCPECGSLRLLKKVAESQLYQGKYYTRGVNVWWMGIIDWLSFWDRYRTLNLKSTDKILEIGFGGGKMINELNKRLYKVYGIDKSKWARDNLSNKIGKGKVFASLDSFKMKFDVVLMYQVLEHIENPDAFLVKLTRYLNNGAKLVVRVPNVNSWEADLAGINWYHADYPYHKFLFSDHGLIRLFERCGYTDILVKNNMLEYRQVLGYSILTKFNIHLPRRLMVVFQIVTIPILWIVSALMAQHGVVEVEGTFHSSNSSRVANKSV
ncbi:MAG: methyltransferase domain-containing protein [Microgenomates group bacterium]